jgi:chemosensory pili system protein ChpB (putative protein-glutamate methylesterase)
VPTPEARRVPIALLSQVGEASRHLREALAGAGTPIVYEAHAAQLDRDALENSGARVVVVNLDVEVDAQLDEVYALLGDERYNVIFNESQVSAQLSGWEQARWARHLAAKILGANDADPPRPEGAQPVPTRVPPVSAGASNDAHDDQARGQSSSAPANREPSAPPIDGDEHDERAGDAALAAFDEAYPTAPAPAIDLADEFRSDTAAAAAATDAFAIGDEFDTPRVDPPATDSAAVDSPDAIGFGDLDDFAADDDVEVIELADVGDSAVAPTGDPADLDFAFDFTELPPVEETSVTIDALDPEASFAEASQAIEAAVEPDGLAELELLDLDWADAPTPPVLEDEPIDVITPPPPVSHSAFSWTLAETEDEAGDEAAPTSSANPTEFGIETISAAEFLAPAAEPDVEPVAVPPPAFAFELVPLEEAVAPQPKQEFAARDNWLDTSAPTAVVQKVWVLGASIGGPEAVREFLGHIPKDYPALFLLAQHMGTEFMDLMAQQLVKTTALTVRTPTHGERVAHGDIVIVPLAHRLRVDREGVVVLEPLAATQAPHSPSIDQLLIDIADRFAAKAGVIVFSGMAEDAAEGSRYLAGKGGKVYVQDPRTCVISSMVDGVLETGVVAFTGSPRELADRLLGERARTPAK